MMHFNTCGLVSEIRTAPQKTTTKKVNKKAAKFYNWFKNIGGNLSFFDASELMQKFEANEEKRIFKTNPEEIKQKYNYFKK